MSTLKEIVIDQLAAFQEKDLDAFMDFYTEDTVVKNFAGDVLVEGKAALRETNRNVFETSPEAHVTVPNWVLTDNFVVAEETFTGVTTPGWPAAFALGVVYEFRDGLISGQIWLQ